MGFPATLPSVSDLTGCCHEYFREPENVIHEPLKEKQIEKMCVHTHTRNKTIG